MNTRSKTCRRTKSGPCHRLTGHKGACRPTLTRAEGRADVRPVGVVEVLSADRYTVQPERKAGKAARRPKVRTLPTAGPDGRDVQRIGHAKRAKAAPLGTKSRSNANALKGRI